MRQVTCSIVVTQDLMWSVYVRGVKVPTTCKVLVDCPPCIPSVRAISEVVKCVDRAVICQGNADEEFVSLCTKRGGTIKGERGKGDTVAFIDNHPVNDCSGQSHPCTVRRVDCDILCNPSRYTLRCKSCQLFRCTLRSSVNRVTNVDDRTSATSHTSYRDLSSAEKDTRLKNLHHSLRVAKQQVQRLKSEIGLLIEKDGISLQDNDASDISDILTEFSSSIDQTYPTESPQRIFWEEQQKYNSLRDKRQMKWHPLVIRFALNLKYMSTSAYRAVRQSGIISLPSQRTLSDYTHWASAHTGVQIEFIEQFKCLLESEVKLPPQYQCALSMDEMKIKSGLVFSKRSGSLVGFIDLGSVNRDMERLAIDDMTANSSNGHLAKQIFVFMARAVFHPSLAVPVAHYPSLNLTGE